MISMRYDLAKLPTQTPLPPISEAGSALARLNERIARSPVGSGWIERSFADACASLWIDGALVHLEDLFLHDATRDIRTPILDHYLGLSPDRIIPVGPASLTALRLPLNAADTVKLEFFNYDPRELQFDAPD